MKILIIKRKTFKGQKLEVRLIFYDLANIFIKIKIETTTIKGNANIIKVISPKFSLNGMLSVPTQEIQIERKKEIDRITF